MKALSAKLANVIENAARGAIPEARFGRECVPSPTEAGTAKALKRLEVYALGGVITVINAAKRHLVEGRIPAPESKTANQ